MDKQAAAIAKIADDESMPTEVRHAAMNALGRLGYNRGFVPQPIDEMARLKLAVDELNKAWAQVGKPYSLWIDWNHRPRRVVITQGVYIERDVLYPR